MTAINEPRSHTAILFFSHRPEREWQNKQFVRHDYAKSRQVADAFYQHALDAAKASGLPVLEVTDARQRGEDFGARLANAFADAFAQGFTHVIAVGNDCPRLHEVDWNVVADRLESGAPVLGPTPDEDGAYLIGLSRPQFDAESFAALPWQSSDLFAALAWHLTEHMGTAPVLLTPRADVNGHRELLALMRHPARWLYPLVARLLAVLGIARGSSWIRTPHSAEGARPIRLRAPPFPHR